MKELPIIRKKYLRVAKEFGGQARWRKICPGFHTITKITNKITNNCKYETGKNMDFDIIYTKKKLSSTQWHEETTRDEVQRLDV